MNGIVADATIKKIAWHTLNESEVFKRTKSSPKGLSSTEASARLDLDGPNRLPIKAPPGIEIIFLHQFAIDYKKRQCSINVKTTIER